MIDEGVFKTEWAILSERFGKKFSAPVTARYFQLLSPQLSTERFRSACASIFSSNEFFPTPEEFVLRVGVPGEMEAFDQWELCVRIMEGEHHVLNRMTPAGQKVVSLLGGPERLGQTKVDSVPFVRRDFLQFYTDTTDADPITLLPELTADSRKIVGEVMVRKASWEEPTQ